MSVDPPNDRSRASDNRPSRFESARPAPVAPAPPQLPAREIRRTCGSVVPATNASTIARPLTPITSVSTLRFLQPVDFARNSRDRRRLTRATCPRFRPGTCFSARMLISSTCGYLRHPIPISRSPARFLRAASRSRPAGCSSLPRPARGRGSPRTSNPATARRRLEPCWLQSARRAHRTIRGAARSLGDGLGRTIDRAAKSNRRANIHPL